MSQLPSTGKQHMWRSSSQRDSFRRPWGWGQVQVQGEGAICLWDRGCPCHQRPRPVEPSSCFLTVCQDPDAKCPKFPWLRALVWRRTVQHVMFKSFRLSCHYSHPGSGPFPTRTTTMLVLSAPGTTHCQSAEALSYLWGLQAFSGFCLIMSSNRKFTPSQSSRNPRAKLEKLFQSQTPGPCDMSL